MIDQEAAEQFALILSSGVPQLDALRYLRPGVDTHTLQDELSSWMEDKRVQRAILALQGKSWESMGLEERLRFAIDKHYTEAAYFLYSHNYATLGGAEKQKADTCRSVIEAKLAGMAGKMDALTHFFDDLLTGKVALPPTQKDSSHVRSDHTPVSH